MEKYQGSFTRAIIPWRLGENLAEASLARPANEREWVSLNGCNGSNGRSGPSDPPATAASGGKRPLNSAVSKQCLNAPDRAHRGQFRWPHLAKKGRACLAGAAGSPRVHLGRLAPRRSSGSARAREPPIVSHRLPKHWSRRCQRWRRQGGGAHPTSGTFGTASRRTFLFRMVRRTIALVGISAAAGQRIVNRHPTAFRCRRSRWSPLPNRESCRRPDRRRSESRACADTNRQINLVALMSAGVDVGAAAQARRPSTPRQPLCSCATAPHGALFAGSCCSN